jgi:16S rRNA (uracil1498-N3)-methyltransferase
MAIRDLASERLYVTAGLAPGNTIPLGESQVHYLLNVLRMAAGSRVLVFNGRDGEYAAEVRDVKKRTANLHVLSETRPQDTGPDIDYVFAPLKRSRLDYMVQKATEMGCARLRPVLTQHTIAERINIDRMTANAIEAAEQCGILRVPDVTAPEQLDKLLSGWDARRVLIFCDEQAAGGGALTALDGLRPGPLAVLIGPEGGFSETERAALLGKPFVRAIALGPRIMRADTAAVAALALVNAVLGDWR